MKKKIGYLKTSVALLTAMAVVGLFARPIKAQSTGKTPSVLTCIDDKGHLVSFGATCSTGGGTCTPAGCPPPP